MTILAYPEVLIDAWRRKVEAAHSVAGTRVRIKEIKPDGQVIFEPILPDRYEVGLGTAQPVK